MKLCIDLCSGLGGFSKAFVDAGWEVITVDIDPKFNPTICADITKISENDIEAKTRLGSFIAYSKLVILASPPCERFSFGRRTWPEKGVKKAFEIVGACMELIAEIREKKRLDCFAIENPKGRLRWFLGKPPITIRQSDFGGKFEKPTDLWTDAALGLSKGQNEPQPWMLIWKTSKSKRAEIPFSQAILEAVSE